jgi:hypothetical protein
MARKLFLQEAAESEGGGIGLLGLAQRKQPIGIYQLHEHCDLASRSGDHAREEKAGEVVGDQHAGVGCQCGEQSFSRIRGELHEG